MARNVIRSLITRILFRSDETGLRKVETHTRQAKREMRAASRAAYTLKRDLRGLAVGWRSLVAVIAVARLAKLFTHDFATGADEIMKFSRATGISTDFLQKFYHAMELGGATRQESEKGIKRFVKIVNDVGRGLKTAKDAFADIGLDPKKVTADAAGLRMVAEAMAGMTNKGKRAAAAQEIFGKAGMKLIPGLEVGREKLAEYFEEAVKLGKVISTKGLKAAEDYNDEMLRAKAVLVGVRNVVALKLIPAITRNVRAFQQWAREGDNLKRMLGWLATAAKATAAALAILAAAKVGQTLAVLVSVTKKAVFWTRLQGRATLIAYAPYIALAAAIAAVVLVIQSLIVWSKGGKSAIGDLFEHFGIADKARAVVDALGKGIKRIAVVALAAGKKIAAAMAAIYQAIWREFGPVIKDLGTALVSLFEEIGPVMVTFAEALKTVWLELITAVGEAWRDLKPSILEIGAAMSEAWATIKPDLKAFWESIKPILAALWEMQKDVFPLLGTVVKTVFKGIAIAIKGSITTLTAFVKTVTFIVRTLSKAYNLMLAIMGLQGKTELGGIATAAAVAGRAPSERRLAQLSIAINEVAVNVSGTADMSPAEFAAAVELGASKGFQDAINDAWVGMRSLVP